MFLVRMPLRQRIRVQSPFFSIKRSRGPHAGGGKKLVIMAFEFEVENDFDDVDYEDAHSSYCPIFIFIPRPSAKAFMKLLKSDGLMVVLF